MVETEVAVVVVETKGCEYDVTASNECFPTGTDGCEHMDLSCVRARGDEVGALDWN